VLDLIAFGHARPLVGGGRDRAERPAWADNRNPELPKESEDYLQPGPAGERPDEAYMPRPRAGAKRLRLEVSAEAGVEPDGRLPRDHPCVGGHFLAVEHRRVRLPPGVWCGERPDQITAAGSSAPGADFFWFFFRRTPAGEPARGAAAGRREIDRAGELHPRAFGITSTFTAGGGDRVQIAVTLALNGRLRGFFRRHPIEPIVAGRLDTVFRPFTAARPGGPALAAVARHHVRHLGVPTSHRVEPVARLKVRVVVSPGWAT